MVNGVVLECLKQAVSKTIPVYMAQAISASISNLSENDDFDLFIALDCGDKERLGESKGLAEKVFTVNIDRCV